MTPDENNNDGMMDNVLLFCGINPLLMENKILDPLTRLQPILLTIKRY